MQLLQYYMKPLRKTLTKANGFQLRYAELYIMLYRDELCLSELFY